MQDPRDCGKVSFTPPLCPSDPGASWKRVPPLMQIKAALVYYLHSEMKLQLFIPYNETNICHGAVLFPALRLQFSGLVYAQVGTILT